MNEKKTDFAHNFAKLGKDIYTDMGHGHFIPTLIVLGMDDKTTIIGLSGVEPGHMYDAVQLVLKGLDTNPKMIALTADVYMEKTPKETDTTEYIRNYRSLGTRFAEGDRNVSEGLHTMVLSPDECISIHQKYRWTPVDGWEWEEPETIRSGKDGLAFSWEWDRLLNGLPMDLTSTTSKVISE